MGLNIILNKEVISSQTCVNFYSAFDKCVWQNENFQLRRA